MTPRRLRWSLIFTLIFTSVWWTILVGKRDDKRGDWDSSSLTSRSVVKPSIDAVASSNDDGTRHQDEKLSRWIFSTTDTLEGSHNTSSARLAIPYQCEGTEYQDFTRRMRQYVEQESNTESANNSKDWGHSSSALLPPNAQVLIVGNAYTRQVTYSLVAQHGTRLTEIYNLEGRAVQQFHFDNGAILWEVASSYVWFNRSEWVRYLENQIHVHLSDLDAVVLGPIGETSCANATTRSQIQLRDLVQPMPHMDCVRVGPPTLEEWASVFDGPIVYVSGFERHNPENVRQAQVVAQWQQKQDSNPFSRLIFVNSRRHVETLGIECATMEKNTVGTCRNHTRGARCVGPLGGYPDLVAWDVMDFLNQYWRSRGTTTHRHNNKTFVPDFPSSLPRTCRAPQIVAPNYPADKLPAIHVFYQCQGPRYFAFGQVLEDHMVSIKGSRPSLWPANTHVLMWGNSHTRQVGRTLVCQYSDQLESMHLLETQLNLLPYLIEPKTGAEVYRFTNNATLTVLTNSHVPYSRQWSNLLRDELQGRTLRDFDAIILGHFNECGGNNSFSADLQALSGYLPDVDCLHTAPPNITEIAKQATDVPLVFVGMFDETRVQEAQAIRQEIIDHRFPDVTFVDTRQLVESIVEPTTSMVPCLSAKRFSTSDCREPDDTLREGAILHACTGPYGGYADVVAWNVTETMWQRWAEKDPEKWYQ